MVNWQPVGPKYNLQHTHTTDASPFGYMKCSCGIFPPEAPESVHSWETGRLVKTDWSDLVQASGQV